MPYTQNGHYFTSTTQQWLKNYRDILLGRPHPFQLPPDHGYAAELEVMAGVRAYFQVSYKVLSTRIAIGYSPDYL
jgi:hypothetical protein